MREDEFAIEINRLLVVLSSLSELSKDEVKLGAVIVDIWIIVVLGHSSLEVFSSSLLVTELEVHRSTLDVTLGHGRVELNGLGQVTESLNVLATKVSERAAHVVCESLVLAELSQLQSGVEVLGGLLVTIAGFLVHGSKASLQLSLSAVLSELNTDLESGWCWLSAERLEVVGDEGWAWKALVLAGHDGLALRLSDLLEESLDGLGRCWRLKSVDNAGCGEIEESLGVLLELLVGVGAAVQCLDVLAVELESGSGVLDNLLPIVLGIIASSAVGVKDWIWLAENGLSVEVDGLVVVLRSVCSVSSSLKLGGKGLSLLSRERFNIGLVDIWKLVGGGSLDSRWLWLNLLEDWALVLLGALLLLALALLRAWRSSCGLVVSNMCSLLLLRH